ncbi:alpha/beta hydrolase family protein [Winogradskyella immobilis]|uniref:Alpha/beta hydrolase n=1 Tax=Winogradskyella immobilis TaxID=2816852 RepID=A0ABS8EN87_9FLAO|nr:alpha/beta hydrolase [Winogradskyella immobilis]MCC1484376.1 alpha/beta hydrolase [Winogradskyella immobilis]MCG0016468.1 alpha/beta hydrolase [Winogradskyella immobilis]
MQRTLILCIATVFILLCFSCTETVEGDWTGTLNVQGTKLPVNFHIVTSGDTYKTTMDVPSQGAKDIQATNTTFQNNELTITVKNMQMQYKGVFGGDVISGTFTQRGNSFPLDFTRMTKDVISKTRPQDPKAPYPYLSEEIKFTNNNANNIELAGTLTLPENVEQPPVVILISGDGGQDRDAAMFGHRPFLVLSDFLTRNGIGVLRVDDRGVGDSKGSQRGITLKEIATDVEAAFSFLQSRTDINDEQIGVLGHSDGGYVAQIVASRNDNIDFTILLGSPGEPFEGSKVHPKEYLSKIKCPVLALNGDKDVIRNAKTHLPAIETVLKESGNTDVTAMELENINHFFQTTTERGSIRAVSSIDETYAPKVLDIIKNWITSKTKQ